MVGLLCLFNEIKSRNIFSYSLNISAQFLKLLTLGGLDLLAELNDGISVDIEMQVKEQKDYLERT